MIDVGKLRERVTIQNPTETYSPSGETTIVWDDVATNIYAEVEGLTSRDIVQAQQANVIASHRIRIRMRPDVSIRSRVIWRGRTMEVASITERGIREKIEMLAKEAT